MRPTKSRTWLIVAAVAALCFSSLANAQPEGNSQTPSPEQEGLADAPQQAAFVFVEGDYAIGEPIATMPFQYAKIGRLGADIRADSGMFTREEVVAPAGTPVFAMSFLHTYSVGYSIRRETKLFWCGVVETPHRLLGKGRTFCLQKGAENSASTLAGAAFNGPTFIHTPQLNNARTSAWVGLPSPYFFSNLSENGGRLKSALVVEEGPANFGSDLMMEMAISEIGAKDIAIAILGRSKEGRSVMRVFRNSATPTALS
jgi:hypothetical protein